MVTVTRSMAVRRRIADRLSRAADKLAPVPQDEEPLLLVARAIAAAGDADNPIDGAMDVIRPLDYRTVCLMFLALVNEVVVPGRVAARDRDSAFAVRRLRELGAPEEAVGRLATEWSLRNCLGVSPESSAAWAEWRIEALVLDHVESELDV